MLQELKKTVKMFRISSTFFMLNNIVFCNSKDRLKVIKLCDSIPSFNVPFIHDICV